jgi:hypothetical protein
VVFSSEINSKGTARIRPMSDVYATSRAKSKRWIGAKTFGDGSRHDVLACISLGGDALICVAHETIDRADDDWWCPLGPYVTEHQPQVECDDTWSVTWLDDHVGKSQLTGRLH